MRKRKLTDAEIWMFKHLPAPHRISKNNDHRYFRLYFILIARMDFFARIMDIQNECQIPDFVVNQDGETSNLLEIITYLFKTGKMDLFNVKITMLLDEFEMSNRWRSLVEFYVITRYDSRHLIPDPVEISINVCGGAPSIGICMFPDTSFEDLEKAWVEITWIKGYLGNFLKIPDDSYKVAYSVKLSWTDERLDEIIRQERASDIITLKSLTTSDTFKITKGRKKIEQIRNFDRYLNAYLLKQKRDAGIIQDYKGTGMDYVEVARGASTINKMIKSARYW